MEAGGLAEREDSHSVWESDGKSEVKNVAEGWHSSVNWQVDV